MLDGLSSTHHAPRMRTRYSYYERRRFKNIGHVVSISDPDPIRREAFLLKEARRIQSNRDRWDTVEMTLEELEGMR